MKKILSIVLITVMLASVFCLGVSAVEGQDNNPANGALDNNGAAQASAASASVYVTVATDGSLKLIQESITVIDTDGDNVLTINDALCCAHDEKYDGALEEGYAASRTEYGLSMTKLWGNDCGLYGYYVNNKSALSLEDPIKEGDYINAFAYKNEDYSDVYCFFDINSAEAKKGDEITLTLNAIGFDEEWKTIIVPVEGAAIVIGGENSNYKTDADGKVTFKLEAEGKILISATSETQTLVPPVCMVLAENTVTDNENVSTDNNNTDATEAPTSESQNDTDVSNDTDGGCGSAVSFSVIAVAALAGAMLIKRNKND